MTLIGWAQIALVLGCVIAAAIPLARYIAAVVDGRVTFLRVLERPMYAAAGIDPARGQGWQAYTLAMLAANAAGFLVLYVLLRLQATLPLNPQGFDGLSPWLAFNTAVSFVTNTNWQAYTGESTLSYLSQMAGLTTQNFLSASTGVALAIAVSRAFRAGALQDLGNFWADFVCITLYVLLPLSIVVGLAFVAMGMPQNFASYVEATTLEGATQTIPMGPAAFQIAIKHLGTNGGGFFGVNSAHPFEGPSALATAVQIFAHQVIPFALALVFGRIVGDRRQGRALLVVMLGYVVVATALIYGAEAAGNPLHHAAGVDAAQGNMEGKEVRFGMALVALFTATTTGASCGAVNAMFDSFTPLGGLVPMFLIQLGEVLPGGVGSGLYGILVFALLAVFVAGLMVGRTPEFLGKKVQAREVKLAMLAVLVLPTAILGFASVAVVLPAAISSIQDAGPHGLSEMLYAYTSAAGNNGSAFGGLTADTPWMNTTLGIAMMLGRFGYMVPVMAIGPLAEHFALLAGQTFWDHPTVDARVHMPPTGEARRAGRARSSPLGDRALLARAALDALRKLNARRLVRNPVIFTTEVVSILVTLLAARALWLGEPWLFQAGIAAWLWLTVLFATFAEALAEGRGRAQADSLRRMRSDVMGKRLLRADDLAHWQPRPAAELRVGDLVLVKANDLIPSDGEVVQGIASVNEAAVTGESAPVIRESGGDRSAVTGGTLVVSDWLVVRITAAPGSTFMDRMIALVEGATRQKTPNEIALDILLAGLTLVFLIAVATVVGFASWNGTPPSVAVLAALLVTLIPTTIGGLISAIGIAGMDRLVRFNVLATSGRAVEAAGDVDVLLLDKTGTITLGNRQAAAFIAAPGVEERDLAQAAAMASLADETPEGRSILAFARDRHGIAPPELPDGAVVVPFTAQTRISGLDHDGHVTRRGAVDAMLKQAKVEAPAALRQAAERIARQGGTPLAVSRDGRLLGVIELKDIVKPNIRDRFDALRRMGIRTVMVTGDNRLTAAAIAAESGVDDSIAEATPQDKLDYIRKAQAEGRLVAMAGDGTNDAPALAQADVGLAMQTGTQAAREAGNMVDLDSDPTKLIEVVEIGKQLLITRGALTTFSIANDVAKYFAILPAIFVAQYPGLGALNVMRLTSPQSAILSALIFNALIIVALVPLALRGVAYLPVGAAALLRRNLLIYGLGGLVVPFIGIKLIDLLLTLLGIF